MADKLSDKLRPDAVVNGPYLRKDGRKHVVLYWSETKKTKTISYPKWLMEQHLGRVLESWETVDHKNRDFTDDRIDNLQILENGKHVAMDAKRRLPEEVVCAWCHQTFTISKGLNSRSRGTAGPFCSRKCIGSYGASVQHGECDPLPEYELPKRYARNEKS